MYNLLPDNYLKVFNKIKKKYTIYLCNWLSAECKCNERNLYLYVKYVKSMQKRVTEVPIHSNMYFSSNMLINLCTTGSTICHI